MKRTILFTLPVGFLLLHLLEVPVPLPSALLPRRVLVPQEARSHPEFLFRALQQYPSLLLPTGEALITLKRRDIPTREDLKAVLAELPQSDAELEQSLGQAVSSLPSLSRILLLLDHTPSASESGALRRFQEEGPPIEIRVLAPPYDPLFLAFSSTFSTLESSLTLDLLFAPRVKEYRSLEVTKDGAPLQSLKPAELAEGRELRTSLTSPESGEVSLGFRLQGSGGSLERELRVRTPAREAPSILMVTSRPASRSFLDALYRLKRVSPSEVLKENLASYPLIVFDGLALRDFGPRLTEAVTEIHRRNAASLFFVSDGPDFGKKGDNPPLERILPAELSPRSLRYLPDLGILILLDISASMMGEKLSLAKVSTLELLKNLKDTDRVSILTFWDQYRFLHGFEEKRALSAQEQIAPLIAQGGTDLFQALTEGLRRLSALIMDEKHALIISDGKTKEADFEGAIRKARLQDISISTLAVGEEVNAELLSRIARGTGGRYYRVKSLQEIPSIIFEDRKEIARSSFALDRFPVFGPERSPAGEVTGMSLFTPKPGRPILYRNQYDDPLTMIERRNRQLTILFLSDLYGTYTSRFFSNPSVARTFRAMLDPVLRRHQLTVRVGEASRELSLTLSGEGLVAPRLELYSADRLVAERSLKPGPFQTWNAEFPVSRPGLYTAVFYSQGAALQRLPVYFNGLLEGLSTDAPRELLRYRARAFVPVPAGNLFLVLFFLTSVAATWLARRSI